MIIGSDSHWPMCSMPVPAANSTELRVRLAEELDERSG